MVQSGLLLVLVCVVVGVRSYPNGPPRGACTAMFPTGHFANAQSSAPPYTIILSATTYGASSIITVALNATQPNTWYYEGVFLQARRAENCDQTTPVGTFSIPSNESFLQTMTCTAAADAISQKVSNHTFYKEFSWRAPATPVGHIYFRDACRLYIRFRATVVKNEKTFWTDVASVLVRDSTAAAPAASWKPCAVKQANAASALSLQVLPLLLGVILAALLAL